MSFQISQTIPIRSAPVVIGGAWTPYTEPSTFLLSFLLAIIGIGLILLARRMKKSIQLPRPRRTLKVVIVIVWIFSIIFFLGLLRILAEKTARTASSSTPASTGPILPITLASALATFVYLTYLTRRGGILSALGNGFIGAAAGPMVFEFPFDWIVIPVLNIRILGVVIFFGPLFAIEFTTFALLLLSKRTSITRTSLYSLAVMLLVFALWALEGFSYPSNPVSFSLNAISKVLSFVTIAALFSPQMAKEMRIDKKWPPKFSYSVGP